MGLDKLSVTPHREQQPTLLAAAEAAAVKELAAVVVYVPEVADDGKRVPLTAANGFELPLQPAESNPPARPHRLVLQSKREEVQCARAKLKY